MSRLNRELRLEILRFLDGLEPSLDGITPSMFTLAPTHLDPEAYRLGWEACSSEVKGFFFPILGFTAEYWADRRRRAGRDAMSRRKRRIDAGMCVVLTCGERATEGQRCAKHAAADRAYRKEREQERSDRVALGVENRRRLLGHLRNGPGKGDE